MSFLPYGSATSLIFILKLPQISRRELSGVVENEARKYIPIPLTEVTLDWWVIPEKEIYGDEAQEDTEIDVLVAAVRNEVVSRYNAVSQKMGKFSSIAFEIETFSAVRGSFKNELSPVMLVDFGADTMKILLIDL